MHVISFLFDAKVGYNVELHVGKRRYFSNLHETCYKYKYMKSKRTKLDSKRQQNS